ncbi:MAG: 3-keto-5-aminohexanoate cleavage protein, partial [Mycobacteriales bacterium]
MLHDNIADVTAATMITVAPTGAETDKAKAPALPVTIEELVATAKACEAEGAALVHVHVRDEGGRSTIDVTRYREAIAALNESTDLVVQVSTGGAVGDDPRARVAVLDCAPQSASLTCGSVNFGDEVFDNPWPLVVELYTEMHARRILPEFEVFDAGHLEALHRLLDRHGPPYNGHVHVDFVLGVPGGMPGTVPSLAHLVSQLPPGATFSATGIGRSAVPVLLATIAAGGHPRVGMEDTLTFAAGEPVRDNAQLVARAAAVASLAQRPPMTP